MQTEFRTLNHNPPTGKHCLGHFPNNVFDFFPTLCSHQRFPSSPPALVIKLDKKIIHCLVFSPKNLFSSFWSKYSSKKDWANQLEEEELQLHIVKHSTWSSWLTSKTFVFILKETFPYEDAFCFCFLMNIILNVPD